MSYQTQVTDPRDPSSEHLLQVEYQATPGAPPIFNDIHGGDPGYGPEYELLEALTKRGHCCLARLTPGQLASLTDEIHSKHEW